MEFKLQKNILSLSKNGTEITFDTHQILNTYENGLSSLICDLSEKEWISTEELYDLCPFIKKFYPNNKIDWIETFYYVEKDRYNQEIPNLMIPNDSVVDKCLFPILDNDEKFNIELKEYAKKELADRGLL